MIVKTIVPAAHMLQNIVRAENTKELVCLMPFRFAREGSDHLTPEIAPGDVARVMEDSLVTDIKWETKGVETSGHLVEYCATGDRYRFTDEGVTTADLAPYDVLTYFGSPKRIPAVQMCPKFTRKHLIISNVKVMKLWDVSFNDVIKMGYGTMEELANSWNSISGKGNKWNDNPTVCRITYKVGNQF